jgi:hypothetical protein
MGSALSSMAGAGFGFQIHRVLLLNRETRWLHTLWLLIYWMDGILLPALLASICHSTLSNHIKPECPLLFSSG